MKVFTIVLGIAGAAVFAGAVAVGCGPQKPYCPGAMSGQCADQDTGVAPPQDDSGAGDATIFTSTKISPFGSQ